MAEPTGVPSPEPMGVPGPDKSRAKSAVGVVIDPTARFLLRVGISADAITILGMLGVVAGAFGFIAGGELVVGAAICAVFALSDMLDGSMARQTGRPGNWGAFLDSTLDRISDAAVLAALTWWYLRGGDEPVVGAVALYCVVAGAMVSYARARAEGLGFTASGGIAERTERMVLVLATTFLAGLGVPFVQAAGLWLLAAAATVTVVQRIAVVRRQARAASTGRP